MARVNVLVLCLATLGLSLTSTAALGLLGLRIDRTGNSHFSFLTWNLFLAWVPYILALALYTAHRCRTPWPLLAAGFGLWLLFLPNAPYILTDFIHLRPDSRVPLWFDFLLLTSFATSGLLLGFASVYLAQAVVSERLGARWGWATALAVLALSGLGIYIGRILRWNSWDALREPEAFFIIVLRRLEDPLGNPSLIATVVLFTAFLAAVYITLYGASLVAWRGARHIGGGLTRRKT